MDHISVMLSHVQLSHDSLVSVVGVIVMMSNYGKSKASSGKQRYLLLCLQWQMQVSHMLKVY